MPDSGPVVSFTFDDFPRSALHVGGEILKSYGACGTYYAAMGLMDTVNHLGEHFSYSDLKKLIEDGHELGSHTFSHISCRETTIADVETEVRKGREAVERVTGIRDSHQFSYPYGQATFRAKAKIGRIVSTCRGIVPGINKSPADLNLLRANSIYSHAFDLDSIRRLIAENEKCRGWLIFYTHDVCDGPSSFGCTPAEFEKVVKLTVMGKFRILTVGNSCVGTTGSKTNSPI